MADFVGHPFVQALAWTLVYFLWQGAAIAIVALVLMRSSRLPWTRYAIGAGALAAMLTAPLVTLLAQLPVPIVADAGRSLASALASAPGSTQASAVTVGGGVRSAGVPDAMLAAIVGLWLAGVGVFGLRLAGGWLVARRVARQAVRPAAAEIQRLALSVGERLGVRRAVTVLESSIVAVPVMVGWLKPVIVLPAAALAGLAPDQLESLIAHELAHVRRHDFLVNLLQSIVEALLFYHPAVWWLSKRVRIERERCCDDVTVGVCDRLVYAEALKALAAMASPRFALAATDGDLLSRIRRVLGPPDDQAGRRSRCIPIVTVTVAAAIVLAVQASFVMAAPGARDQVRINEVPAERLAPSPAGEIVVTQGVAVPHAQAAQTRAEREGTTRQRSDTEQMALEYIEVLKRDETALEGLQLTVQGQATAVQIEEAQAKEQIERARVEAERIQALFDRGLVSQTQVAEVEAKLQAAMQRWRDAVQKQADLMQHQGQPRDVEKALAELRLELDQHLRATMHDRAAEIERARRELDQHLKATAQAREAALEHARGLAPVDGPAAAGDLLEVRIGGEPELPTHHEVRADGTIRLPFLGSFKVVGQTAAQVQAAIGKQMADRKLGSANQVTVSVLRRK